VGVAGAAVRVEGGGTGAVTTDASGWYTLYGMRRGEYRIRVEAARAAFPVMAVLLSPANPQLPDIIADR
jgi:hypothetical protein